ncbi:MAG: hypothetical protein COC16_05670 [Lutibacter sp.]|nr:MAG: hypothetical protein COC16_05670 [Lutibacter sp.]
MDYVDRIIINLSGIQKCVFESLDNLNLYNSTIEKFVGNKDFHLQINYSNDCASYVIGASGCTDTRYIDLGLIIINITDNWGDKLSLASTMLHEGIHATLFKYAHSRNPNIDPNIDPKVLMDLILQYKNVNLSEGSAQHEYMMSYYVIPIAQAIRNLDNNSYPIEYYYGFGWSGLGRYGRDQDVITQAELDNFENLKQIVNSNTSYGINCN